MRLLHPAVKTASAAMISLLGILRSEGADLLPPVSERYSQPTVAETPDFQKHVVPLLGRLGCNGRSCHGSFQGRGGFQLSLFGYDFPMDHAALTAKAESQNTARVDRKTPDQSLILQKPTTRTEHEGGLRFKADSWEYRLLLKWIAAQTPTIQTPQKLERLEVTPAEITAVPQGSPVPLNVVAIWSDGSREDVTCLCRFRSNDDGVATVDSDGRVTGTGTGDTHIIAFYDNGVASIPVLPAVSAASAADQQTAWPRDPRTTWIDSHINTRLQKLGYIPSAVCTDTEFLRRLSIDLTGTLPTPDEVTQFLADSSADKRDRKIDELLQRSTFSAWWANKLCDFTGCNPNQQAELGQELAEQWYMWMYQRLQENTPYDEIVERILLAVGRENEQSYDQYSAETSAYFRGDSPADFAQRHTMPHYWSRRSMASPKDKALAVAHSFLGLRLQCAECHKHPWDQWTQDDFRQFSSFFDNVTYGIAPDAQDSYARLAGKVGLPVKGSEGAPVRPDVLVHAQEGRTVPWREVYVSVRPANASLNLLGSGRVPLSATADPRIAIMSWMRDSKNPWFARAIVNRVWASCFPVGIVDPPDDLNAANPPANAALLDDLSEKFIEHEYDLRWLLREITRSSAWQRSLQPNSTNEHDRRNFSRALPRRIPAEVLYDGIKQAVAADDQQQAVRLDISRRAVGHLSMRMAGTYAMHVFGKPERAVTCDCERVNEPTLLQAVFMQNDPLILMQLEESGWLKQLDSGGTQVSDDDLKQWINNAWLRAVSRPATEAERTRSLQHVRLQSSPAEGIRDVLWALLNTKEFLLNH